MTFRRYRFDNLRQSTLDTIERVNEVLDRAAADNVRMTVRSIYYKFVKNGWIPNADREYKNLGTAIDAGRMNGLISWDAIEDMERSLYGINTSPAPEALLEGLDEKFHLDLWADQDWRPEVWVEKKGMVGVISAICNELRVDFFPCKGYNSQTEAYKAGRRMARYIRKGQRPIVFHLGDHDPSGLDMTRDNRERLELFAGVPVTVVRLALNMDQIEELQPPENPAKTTDIRITSYARYMFNHGYEDPKELPSWEVDALEPTYIRDLIRDNVDRLRDEERWSAALAREVAGKEWLRTVQGGPKREDDEEDE